MQCKRTYVTWELILQGVYCAKRVRIIIGTGRDSKFIVIGGVKSHNVTEDQYEDSVAVLEYSLPREYTTTMAHTESFMTLGYNFGLNS
jgi:hypothetical protein